MNPLGGLSRRKQALARMSGTPVLLLDAGNALFVNMGSANKKEKDRAAFVLSTMGKLGTRAMAVGHRDLSAGVGWLEEQAKKAGVQPLSANLKVNGKPVFPGSMVVDIAGMKVGLVGITAPGPAPGLQNTEAGPTLAAAREELKKLPEGLDLRIILATTSTADALQLLGELKGAVDLVLESGDMRPAGVQAVNHNYLASAGERGRQLQQLNLALGGKGDFEDLDEVKRTQELLDRSETNLKTLADRRKAADSDWAKAQLDTTIAEVTKRRDELKAVVAKGTAKGARTLSSRTVNLDSALGDDEALRKLVEQIEPPGTAAHP